MAEAIRATATAVPAPTGNVISHARGGTVRVVLTDIEFSLGYLAIGSTAADPPATYADLDWDFGGASASGALDSVQAEYNGDTGLYAITIRRVLDPPSFDAGRKIWALWFDGLSAAPGPTVAPDLVSLGLTVVD